MEVHKIESCEEAKVVGADSRRRSDESAVSLPRGRASMTMLTRLSSERKMCTERSWRHVMSCKAESKERKAPVR